MEINFKWIGGATFILSIDNLKIAVDPILCEAGAIQDYFWFKSKRVNQPVYKNNDFENIDLWLITHKHEDHLDDAGISKIKSDTRIVCNKNSAKILRAKEKTNITVLKWHDKLSVELAGCKIEIEAVPAIHGINPLSAMLAGNVNGYCISVSKGPEKYCIYITGDTVYKKKVTKAVKWRPIDLLIPNMGAAKQGTWIMSLTLNSKMLKRMINDLQPKKVIPVHYGTFAHYNEPVDVIKSIKDHRIKFVDVGEEILLNSIT